MQPKIATLDDVVYAHGCLEVLHTSARVYKLDQPYYGEAVPHVSLPSFKRQEAGWRVRDLARETCVGDCA